MLRLFSFIFALVFATAAHSASSKERMIAFGIEFMEEHINSDVIISAIRERNAVSETYGRKEVREIEAKWVDEVGKEDTPTIDTVVKTPAADYLRTALAASGGRVTEVMVMDAFGLNVATSHVTVDFIQSDEAKYLETLPRGAYGLHLSDIAFDDITERYQAQISMTVIDPETGQPIGAVSIGLDAESFF